MGILTRLLYLFRNLPSKDSRLKDGSCYEIIDFTDPLDTQLERSTHALYVGRLRDLGLKAGMKIRLVRQSILSPYAYVFDIAGAGRLALSSSEVSCLNIKECEFANA